MRETSKQALLKKAAGTVGIEALAVALKVPVALLAMWISGHASMPDRKFLLLADFHDKLSTPDSASIPDLARRI